MSLQESITNFEAPVQVDVSLQQLWRESGGFIPQDDSAYHSGQLRMHATTGLLLRKHTDNELCYGPGAHEAVALAKTHYSQLQAFGMRVVGFTQEPRLQSEVEADRSSMDAKCAGNVPTAHTASRYVPYSRALTHDLVMTLMTPHQAHAKIIAPLREYMTWCQETSQEWYLSDIHRIEQQSIITRTGETFLHDVDPYFRPITDTSLFDDRVRAIGAMLIPRFSK